jgi:hypothetical protein
MSGILLGQLFTQKKSEFFTRLLKMKPGWRSFRGKRNNPKQKKAADISTAFFVTIYLLSLYLLPLKPFGIEVENMASLLKERDLDRNLF